MKRVGIVYLISESPEAKGVLEAATEKKRKTYCEIRSIGMAVNAVMAAQAQSAK